MKINIIDEGFATVENIECRLTKNSKSVYANIIKKNLVGCHTDERGIYRKNNGEPILIGPYINKVEKAMRKKGFTKFDYDTKIYGFVKCYK